MQLNMFGQWGNKKWRRNPQLWKMTALPMMTEGIDTAGPTCIWTWREMEEWGLEKGTIKISQYNQAGEISKPSGEKYWDIAENQTKNNKQLKAHIKLLFLLKCVLATTVWSNSGFILQHSHSTQDILRKVGVVLTYP